MVQRLDADFIILTQGIEFHVLCHTLDYEMLFAREAIENGEGVVVHNHSLD
jgi:hypothetical protein